MPPEDIETLVSFFKALSHESRLRIVGLLAESPRSVDELAALLGLTAPTVSHHLARLRAIGLVEMEREGTTHMYRLLTRRLETLSREILAPETLDSVGSAPPRAFEDKVLASFLDGPRLRSIPATRKKRAVILDWLVERFERDRDYPEREVNDIIARHHPDTATLRRELVGANLMSRERGVYRRTA